ncbi:hypothetical protein FQA39_LY05013 [Lamprigera yunnana]|nr:hypothetical protein FQA39_LY05013 [Lamprigera yunnana]
MNPNHDADDKEDDGVPSITEVINKLKEEGMYDPQLNNQEMLEFYQAVSNSKTTASAEDEQRRKLSIDIVDDLHLHSDLDEDELNLDSFSTDIGSSFRSPFLDMGHNKFDEVDVFNSAPIQHPPLSRITYTPKYNPPLYCNSKIINLPFEEKKKIISEYHKKLISIYDCHQRRATSYVPLGRPIQSDVTFNGTLLKSDKSFLNFEFEDDNDYEQSQDDNSNDIYILKTGRQTKRKLYTETRGDEKKKTLDSPRTQAKKRTNLQLKKDDTKRTKLMPEFNLSRAERLFDQVIEGHKKDEKEDEKFVKSLQLQSDDDNDIEEVKIDEPFIRRKVIPPLRGKRGRGGRINRNNDVTNILNGNKDDLEIQTDLATKKKNGACPLCNLEFSQDKLESHVDECLEFYNKNSAASNTNQITCGKCDKVLPLDMDYEIHVRDCLNS